MSAVPNRGLQYIRIHSLFNLLSVHAANATHPIPASTYDWTMLDEVMDMLVVQHGQGLVLMLMSQLAHAGIAYVFGWVHD